MQNKNAVLCGASQGLGNTIAKKLFENGWSVHILDLVPKEDPHFTFYECDVSNFESTKKCINEIIGKHKTIDALINCIRYRKKAKQPACFSEEWKKGIDVDLHTFFNACSLVCDHMKNIGSGCSIINISSVLSECITLTEPVSYHASKAAINQLTRYLAVQYGPFNIRVNAISPGLISNHHSEKSSSNPDASLYAKLARHIPLRRTGDPKEIAELVLFLASATSSFITGQNIVIDGGLMIREQLGILSD